MIHVVTRNLASKIPVEKPIVFSFAMKDMSVPTLRATEQLVLQHAVWWQAAEVHNEYKNSKETTRYKWLI